MEYRVYFFREKNNTVDLPRVVDFFESIAEIETVFGEDMVKFSYSDGVIANGDVVFYITKTLLVPNIYKLNPRYISINFHVEMNPIMPSFSAKIAFGIMEILCRTFNLFIYNDIFENVLPYKTVLLENSYQVIKKHEYEKKTKDKIYLVEKEKLDDVLTYQRENYALQLYYKDLDVYAPRYVFLVDEDHNVRLAIEWKEGTKTIFPFYLDLILYKTETEVKLLYKSQIFENIDRYLVDVPGFTKGTKMIDDDKLAKKIRKVIQKSKLNRVNGAFEQIELKEIIDL